MTNNRLVTSQNLVKEGITEEVGLQASTENWQR